jgi:hypothetical protein
MYVGLRSCAEKCVVVGFVRTSAENVFMAKKTPTKVTVLLSDEEFERFDNFCRDRGFKKSTLLARLIRQYLDIEGYQMPRDPNRNPFGRGSGTR